MSNDRDVVIVEGIRTPFAKAGLALKDVHPAELGKTALTELIAKTNLDVTQVDEVIIGNTGNPSDSVNIARVIALKAGLPKETSAYTVHRNCASALESISNGFEKIKSGTMDVVICGGTESMSQLPLLFTKDFQDVFGEFAFARSFGKKMSALKKFRFKYLMPRIAVVEGLTDHFAGINMGQTAEILAKEFGLSREEQDIYATMSHNRAIEAQKNGKLAEEITPVYLPPKFKNVVESDVGPRDGQTVEKLAKLKPYFDRKNGTVTVGNACPLTDGAAMVLLMSRKKAKELGYTPLAQIRSYGFAGLEPERMGLGPVYSTPVATKRAGINFSDIGLIELNEAFAAQTLACFKAFASDKFSQTYLGLDRAQGEIDINKVNVNGGAIALGHPVGTTGTRITLTLMKEMKRTGTQFGLATLCIGGGQGGSLILENEA